MGIHLCVQTSDGRDVPDWDFCRHSGDRDFSALRDSLPVEVNQADPDLWRPNSFEIWRERCAKLENPGRFSELLAMLEREPSRWIYVSW